MVPVMAEIRLLGPVEAYLGRRKVELLRPQLRTVLAVLAAEAPRPVSPETMIDRVWNDEPPPAARGVLYSHIARIRRLLEAGGGTAVVRQAAGYALQVNTDDIDLHRFRRLAAEAAEVHRTDRERADRLDAALSLWRGTPLADVPGDWAARTRFAWLQQRLDVAVAWAQAHLRLGHSDRVIGGVRDLLAEFPLAEPLAAAMMRGLAMAGRDAEALECFAAVRRRLADELGADPGAELQGVHRAILRGEPARVDRPRPAQLPLEARGFSGRARAIALLDGLLTQQSSTAVVGAISGAAGIGKTALAVHWGHRVAARFPDGQLFVNMRGFDRTGREADPLTTLRGLLCALGVPAAQVPSDMDERAALYRSVLARQRVLIVLDNVRDADQVRPLLPGHAPAFVLVTSRSTLTPLVVAEGAHPVNLDVMSTPEAHSLLANRLGPHRVAAEPEAVQRIIDGCARLPLALATAAARAQLSGASLTDLATELTDATRRRTLLNAC
jgi:DNA-binding SARP family transcriptional activator